MLPIFSRVTDTAGWKKLCRFLQRNVFKPEPRLLYKRLRNEPSADFICSACEYKFETDEPAEALQMFVIHRCGRPMAVRKSAGA